MVASKFKLQTTVILKYVNNDNKPTDYSYTPEIFDHFSQSPFLHA